MFPWNELISVSHPQPYTKLVNKWHPGAPSYRPQSHLEPQTCLSTGWRHLFSKKARAVTILNWRKCPGRQRKEGGIGLRTTTLSEEIRAKSCFSVGWPLDLPTKYDSKLSPWESRKRQTLWTWKTAAQGLWPSRQGLELLLAESQQLTSATTPERKRSCMLPACLAWPSLKISRCV